MFIQNFFFLWHVWNSWSNNESNSASKHIYAATVCYCVWIAESVLQHELSSSIFARQNAMLMKWVVSFFFEYVTLHARSYHHRPKLVHDQEVSMTFQERHEAGLHEGLVNIALNGEAFKTHAWRLRKSSVSSLSHISYNRILWTLKHVGAPYQILDHGYYEGYGN